MFYYSIDILHFKLFEIFFLGYLSLSKFLFSNIQFFEIFFFEIRVFRNIEFSRFCVFEIMFFGYIFRDYFFELIFFDLFTHYQYCFLFFMVIKTILSVNLYAILCCGQSSTSNIWNDIHLRLLSRKFIIVSSINLQHVVEKFSFLSAVYYFDAQEDISPCSLLSF
jgi:hypothetical protein